LNALTGAEAPVAHQLFHTLDPMTRAFEIAGRTYLITDTVGFIRKLPHQLVESFAATLQETIDADLILHVVDASSPEDERIHMMVAVDDTLHEIGADERPRLLVMNKVDLLDDEARRELSFRHPDAVQVSAVTGEGLEDLAEAIEGRFLASLRTMDLLVPYEEGGSLSELHDVAGEMERSDTADGVRVKARVPAGVAPRFERFNVNGTSANGDDPAHERASASRASARRRRRRCARTRVTPAATCSRPSRRASRPGSAPAWEPGLQSRSRRGAPAWCCRAAGWRRSTASRSSMPRG
jgi:GTP-binding protein HflX